MDNQNHHDLNDAHNNFLSLSLSTPPPPPPPPTTSAAPPEVLSRQRRPSRRPPNNGIRLRPGKPNTIPPPHPWATARRATAHSLRYLQARGVNAVSGTVRCKRCDRQFEIEYDLQTKFLEVAMYVMKRRDEMRDRAPAEWRDPRLPDCRFCGETKCAKPVAARKKRQINWVFLFLGQMIGFCKLSELKYFCKHTGNHRTGAKDRVLYLTYLELCRQLHPEGSSAL